MAGGRRMKGLIEHVVSGNCVRCMLQPPSTTTTNEEDQKQEEEEEFIPNYPITLVMIGVQVRRRKILRFLSFVLFNQSNSVQELWFRRRKGMKKKRRRMRKQRIRRRKD